MPGPITPITPLSNLPSSGNFLKSNTSLTRLSNTTPIKSSFYDQARQKVLQQRALQKLMAVNIKANANTTTKDLYKIKVGGTGSSFRNTGVSGFQERLKRFIREGKMTRFSNLNAQEQQKLHEIISKRMQSKAVSADITAKDKLIMRKEALQAYKNGEISRPDLEDFKKIIDKLEK